MYFADKYKDTWLRINKFYVCRCKDNNIGLWGKGKGLKIIY